MKNNTDVPLPDGRIIKTILLGGNYNGRNQELGGNPGIIRG